MSIILTVSIPDWINDKVRVAKPENTSKSEFVAELLTRGLANKHKELKETIGTTKEFLYYVRLDPIHKKALNNFKIKERLRRID